VTNTPDSEDFAPPIRQVNVLFFTRRSRKDGPARRFSDCDERVGNMNRLVLVTTAAVIALLAAGCMSGGTSDRSARKAALNSETTGAAIGSMTIAGVPSTVDLYGFSWGAVGGGGAHTNHFTLVKKIDPVSTNLTRATLTNQILSSVTIQLLPAGGRAYATYELANVLVESVDQSAGDGAEQVALAAGGCVSFTPTGGTRVGWDNARSRVC
jgi:hypothetical protein